MAETKCAKGRRESVPVGLREKGCEARFIFVLPCRFIGGGVSFALRFRVLAMPLGRSLLCLEPIAFAVHLQDVDMMGEPVEQGAGEPFEGITSPKSSLTTMPSASISGVVARLPRPSYSLATRTRDEGHLL